MSDTVLKIGKGVSVWEPETEGEVLDFFTSNLTKFVGSNAHVDLKSVSSSIESNEYEYIVSYGLNLNFLLVIFKEIRTQNVISAEAFFQQDSRHFIEYLKMAMALREMRRLGLENGEIKNDFKKLFQLGFLLIMITVLLFFVLYNQCKS
jgi:hypothetical protein